jgi:hypothetical protein
LRLTLIGALHSLPLTHANLSMNTRPQVAVKGLSVDVSSPLRFEIRFSDNNRNVQLLLPLNLTLSFSQDTQKKGGTKNDEYDAAALTAVAPPSPGLMVVVTNKFIDPPSSSASDPNGVTLAYAMGGGAWKAAVVEDGVLVLDDALYVPYTQTPSDVPWAPSGLQRAE